MVALHAAVVWALVAGERSIIASTTWLMAVISAVAVATTGFVNAYRARAAAPDLLLADERLRIALELAGKVAWDWDVTSGRDLWLGDLKTMFGIDASQFTGRVEDFHRRLHPDDRVLVASAVADARQNKTPYRATFRIVRPDGVTRWVDAQGAFRYDESGQPTRMLGIATDITEQAEVERTLREREEQFRNIADSAPVLLWLATPDGRYTWVNRSRREFTGRRREEELGTGWAEGLHPQDRHRILDAHLDACGTREPFVLEYRLRRHDGVYRWILDAGVPRIASDGSFAGFVGSALDITDRKSARLALANLSHRLMDAQEFERSRIARELDDDVLQRMALLTIELEELIHSVPERSHALEARADHVRSRAGDLVTHLQTVVRRLHSRSKLELLGLSAAAAIYCRDLAERQNLVVDFTAHSVPPDLPSQLALPLFRVMEEALANAIAHSGVRQFDVSLRRVADVVELSVADAGRGFDPAAAIAGPGTGVVAMRERLRAVGGALIVDSQPGAGTKLRAVVPLVARHPEDDRQVVDGTKSSVEERHRA